MKKIIILLALPALFVSLSSFTTREKVETKKEKASKERAEKMVQHFDKLLKSVNYDFDAFFKLTPKQYNKLTGERLSLKEKLELKIVQKQLKQQSNPGMAGGTLPKWAYIVLSILALGFLAIGVKSNWTGNDWWICLLLTCLFILPGIIYALIVMKKYY